jgi:hypothetical protein
MKDPTSRLQAAKNGWKFPASQEWALLAELYDLTVRINSKKKPKPLPRPWPSSNSKKIGSTTADPKQVLRNLERMNPKE